MKQFFTFFGIFTATIGFNQLTNNMPTVGQVSIGTTTPAAGKQLTVSGETKLLNAVEIDGNTTLNGHLIINGISNVGDGDLATIELLLKTPTGDVKTVSIRDVMQEMYSSETHELALCEEALLAHPQWYNGLKKIYSPCDEVKVGLGTSNPQYLLDIRGINHASIIHAGNEYEEVDGIINGFTSGAMDLIDLGTIIGTTKTSKFKITNDGTVYAKEIRIRLLTDFPDYVFNDSYDLMSLKALENYIKTNKKLPNMPSASEVEKLGMNLSDVQVKLVEKVEELTLYTIQINKENEILKNEMNALKKELQEIKNLLK